MDRTAACGAADAGSIPAGSTVDTKNHKLRKLFNFVDFLYKFRNVERAVAIKDSNRPENDLEHSAQLAYVAWYMLTTHEHTLDLGLVLRYALVHDLVEVYAGDTVVYDEEHKKSKVEREQKALEQIRREFPEASELTDLIDAYETRNDRESRFVYALDKLMPAVNNYLSGGVLWRKLNVTLKRAVEEKQGKIAGDPIVAEYYKELLATLVEREEELFGCKTLDATSLSG